MFEVEAPASVPAHDGHSRVEHLLMNPVGNAVKYSLTGGPIWVQLRSSAALGVRWHWAAENGRRQRAEGFAAGGGQLAGHGELCEPSRTK